MKLVYKATQQPVKVGDKVQIGNEEFAVLDFLPPHKPEAQGKVTVGHTEFIGTSFYVSVIGAEWIEREDRAKDQTLASLAARLGFSSLATSNSGADFKEVSVWSMKEALEAAYEAGRRDYAIEHAPAVANLIRASNNTVRYLADLNGSAWIKGDDAGSIDIRQRAKALQSVLLGAVTDTIPDPSETA